MDHELSESQELLRRSARDFFTREYPLDRMQAMYAGASGYDIELWRTITDLGWNSMPFPEAIGGVDGSLLDAAVLLEEMGRAACISPYNHSTIAAGLALVEARPDLAGAIARGEAVVIPASPLASSDSPITANSSGRNGEVQVSGRLAPVPWADLATHVLLPGDADGTAVLVRTGQRGIMHERLNTSGGDPLFDLRFSDAEGTVLPIDDVTRQLIVLGAAANALTLLGLCERALELAVAYAKERIQFGRPIGSFQAIQHKCANMLIEIEIGRNLAYKAAWLHARHKPFDLAARYAKSYLGDVTGRVTREAIQVHGGVGYVANHKVQLMYKIGAATAATYGTSHEHRRAIADAVLAGGRSSARV